MSDDKMPKKDEATPKEQERGKGSFTNLGYVGPDDPVYSSGLMVSGRKILLPPQKSSPEKKGGC